MKNKLQVFGIIVLSSIISLGCVTQQTSDEPMYPVEEYKIEDDSEWQSLKEDEKVSPNDTDGFPENIFEVAFGKLLNSKETTLYFYKFRNTDVDLRQNQEDAARHMLNLKEIGFSETIDPKAADYILEASFKRTVSEIRSGTHSITDREITINYRLIETGDSVVVAENRFFLRYYMLSVDYEIVDEIIVQKIWQ